MSRRARWLATVLNLFAIWYREPGWYELIGHAIIALQVWPGAWMDIDTDPPDANDDALSSLRTAHGAQRTVYSTQHSARRTL